jgi:hypothetical protein
LGVDLRDIDQLVRVKDAKSLVMEFDNAFGAQIAQDAVDVNEGQTGRVANMLLG